MKMGVLSIALIAGALAVVVFATLVAGMRIAFPVNTVPQRTQADLFVQVTEGRIRYQKSVATKSEPAIILLHSFGATLEMWDPLVNKITCGTVFRLDLIGSGASEAQGPVCYSLDTHRRVLIDFMDTLGIKTAVLIGSSMGGSIALWTAAQNPDRVSGLLVAAPSAYPGSMHHSWPMDYVYRPGRLNRFFTAISRTALYKRFFHSSLAQQSLEITGSYAADFLGGLQRITQPMAILWSKSDKRVPFVCHERYLELCRNT
jgi:pimeloyl-ACP methyl ester carboxylesterase